MNTSKKIKDARLIAQYQHGDSAAMALLVKRWHVVFCKQAYKYCQDAAIAKDIAQDSWIRILSNVHTLNEPSKFGSWGLSIVTKKSIDWYRKNQRHIQQESVLRINDETTTSEKSAAFEVKRLTLLKHGILELSEEHQQVLRLFYIESYGLMEISELLNISKGTVKSRLFYAREKLKVIIKE